MRTIEKVTIIFLLIVCAGLAIEINQVKMMNIEMVKLIDKNTDEIKFNMRLNANMIEIVNDLAKQLWIYQDRDNWNFRGK